MSAQQAAVAAKQKEARERTLRNTSWVLASGIGLALLIGVGKLLADIKTGIANRNRPLKPWEF